MIFGKEPIAAILKGSKTVTRRPVVPYVEGSPWIVSRSGRRRPRPVPRTTMIDGVRVLDLYYKEGSTYGVQSRNGKPAVARIKMVRVTTEPLDALTYEDARNEGHSTRDSFYEEWANLHGADFDPSSLVWVMRFKLITEQRLRLLAPSGSGRDYTEVPAMAIDDAGECLDIAQFEEVGSGQTYVDPDAQLQEPGSVPVSRLKVEVGPSAMDRLEAELKHKLRHYEGDSPEDVYAKTHGEQGTPGDIRARRREMGVRVVDGLPALTAERERAVLARMLLDGRSVRDIAYVLDVGKSTAARRRLEYLALGDAALTDLADEVDLTERAA